MSFAELAHALARAYPRAHFGAAPALDVFMGELNNEIALVDDWVHATQPVHLGFVRGWHAFVYADPPVLSDTRPEGWDAFYRAEFPPAPDDAELARIVQAFEREFVRWYDMATLGGATPPIERREPMTAPWPDPHVPPDPTPPPPPPPPPKLATTSGYGVGVLFLLAGLALYTAGRTNTV